MEHYTTKPIDAALQFARIEIISRVPSTGLVVRVAVMLKDCLLMFANSSRIPMQFV
jgi:hypothetical protein